MYFLLYIIPDLPIHIYDLSLFQLLSGKGQKDKKDITLNYMGDI